MKSDVETPELDEYERRLAEEEAFAGLEYVGPEAGLNRSGRRDAVKTLKRVTRRPVAVLNLHHPLLGTLTPWGAKRLKRRRAKNKVAHESRRRNRR